MLASPTDLIDVTEHETYVNIELNRPEKLNAINKEMARGLVAILEELTDNPTKGILLTGAGRATCAGVDLDIVTLPPEEKPEFKTNEHLVFELLAEYPAPTAFAGKDAVIGAAFILAIDCDITILGENTRFSFPEIQYGIYSGRALAALREMVGIKAAKYILLSGEPIEPRYAKNLGIVTDVVNPDDVESSAIDALSTMCAYDAEVVTDVKNALSYNFNSPYT